MNLILASASPRREELLKLITDKFEVIPSDVQETVPVDLPLENHPQFLASLKAEHISKKYPDCVVIGADTLVFIDGKALGKPENETAAFNMLKLLSGKTHTVITGCAIYKNGNFKSFSSVTYVEFYELTDDEIYEYISTGEPFDKAGAYGIQGFGATLVKKINGDYFNIVGLPVSKLKRELALI